jgi:hypothetical protein
MMRVENAETFALQALAWLASDEDLLGGFMGMTGLDHDQLRARAGDGEFLGAVLDYILSADTMVLDCAAALNCPPDQVVAARAALPGGAQVHWT